jgi:radical SAM superfamily enzyme YgiQ (UPF0313 family)
VDAGLAWLMAQAGCVEASLGFESGSPAILANLIKKYTPEEVRRTSEIQRDVGIRRIGFLLLGGP